MKTRIQQIRAKLNEDKERENMETYLEQALKETGDAE